jgi:AraC-like DNA-binding protein
MRCGTQRANWTLEAAGAAFGCASVRLVEPLVPAANGRVSHSFSQSATLREFSELYGRGHKRTLSQAAFEAGFGSYAQFHRVAQSLTGLSPRDWSRAAKGEMEDDEMKRFS